MNDAAPTHDNTLNNPTGVIAHHLAAGPAGGVQAGPEGVAIMQAAWQTGPLFGPPTGYQEDVAKGGGGGLGTGGGNLAGVGELVDEKAKALELQSEFWQKIHGRNKPAKTQSIDQSTAAWQNYWKGMGAGANQGGNAFKDAIGGLLGGWHAWCGTC